jgi:hypothetical protein
MNDHERQKYERNQWRNALPTSSAPPEPPPSEQTIVVEAHRSDAPENNAHSKSKSMNPKQYISSIEKH